MGLFMALSSSLQQSRRRAVEYLTFNRNLLPMFPALDRL